MTTRFLLSLFAAAVLIPAAFAQSGSDYPVATPTDQPDVVISPYSPNRQLDVAGLPPGSLAEDPVAGKIFRIPFSNPTKRYYQDYLGKRPLAPAPQIDPADSVASPPDRPAAPSWIPAPGNPPPDLIDFLVAFNRQSSANDPDALMPFYADRLDNYFGQRNVSKDTIRSDRASYIKRFPVREYVLDGAPVLLSSDGETFEVMARVRYRVEGGGTTRSGSVSDYLALRRVGDSYRIESISEAKADAAPPEVQARDSRGLDAASSGRSPLEDTVYNRLIVDQILLFFDALAASGEVNEPSAMVDFLHPEIETYYTLENPSRAALIKDRADYIERWPERRYWLAEQPRLTQVGPGTWDAVVRLGYEVKQGSKKADGIAVSSIRLVQTEEGLKILSIVQK